MDRWSRRDFLRIGLGLTGLGLLAGCGVVSAPSQGTARTPRIGFLAPGPRDDFLRLPPVRRSLRLLADRGLAFDVPDAWPRHLAATADLAAALEDLRIVVDHLGKKWEDSIEAYDKVHVQILKMADALADGIAKQFPQKVSN